MNEKKELLNMLKEMWQKGNSPLRRIYSSWEELEANVEIQTEKATQKYVLQPCPNCGVKQKITKPLEDFFPYQKCAACSQPFYVKQDLTVRKLTGEEKEMPQAWVQIVEDINKKKLAVAFKLE